MRIRKAAKEMFESSISFDHGLTNAHEAAFVFAFGPKDLLKNFLCRQSPGEGFSLKSCDSVPVDDCGLALFSRAGTHLADLTIEKAACHVIISGKLFSTEDGTFSSALRDILNFAEFGKEWLLGRLGGLFVAAVWRQREGELLIITDRLGVSPFFFCETGGLIVGGSNAIALADLIGIEKRAHYGAISQYLLFGYNATGNSLIDGVQRLPSQTLRWRSGRRLDTQVYIAPTSPKAPIGNLAMADRVHDLVSRSYTHWTQGEDSLVIGLSGGFDSRYLAGIAASQPAPRQRFITVGFDPSELVCAQSAASALRIRHEIVTVEGSLWDAYSPESIFHVRPDGFPVTKSVCRLVAMRAPDWPVVDGYLGDALIRGHLDHLAASISGAKASNQLALILESMEHALVKRLAPRHHAVLRDYAFAEARAMHKCVGNTTRAITFADLFLRQRRYIDNNFLQNAPNNSPILPFYDPSLIQLKIEYPTSDFGSLTYSYIFQQAFPALSGISHNKDVVSARSAVRISEVHKKWTRHLLTSFLFDSRISVLDHRFIFPRLLRDALNPRDQYLTQAIIPLVMLEKICNIHNIFLDWSFGGEV